jgi:4-hydroxy-3-polyprenylbenzoate decarboxylase
MGGIVLPPLPAFYLRPQSLAEIVDHTVARILDQLDIAHSLMPEWTGTPPTAGK